MVTEIFSSTSEFPDPSSASAMATTDPLRRASLDFYSLRRLDLTTELTLAALLARAGLSEEETFSQAAVRSAPQSWRDL